MLRIFFPLFIILAVFLIGFTLAVEPIVDTLLATKVNDAEEKLTRGTFYLIEQELTGLSDKEMVQKVIELQPYFGYPLSLLNTGGPLLSKDEWKHLEVTGFLASVIDEVDYYFKKIEHTDRVIAFAASDGRDETDHREAQGTFYLVQKTLSNYPQSQWNEKIKQLQSHFGAPLSLYRISDLDLPAGKIERLQNNKIIAVDHDTDQWRYYGKLQHSPYVVKLGPIKPPISDLVLISGLLGIFLLLLSIAIYLWLHPLMRSVKILSQAADDFGQGKLDSRAKVKKGAMLGKLATQFNAMAERISSLITGQRELTNAVSHELRTPIARMHFGLEMLAKTDEKSRQRYLEGLNADANDLEGLVNELLHYARFEQVELSSELENIQIFPWLEELIEYARGYADNINLYLINRNVPEACKAQFAPKQMARVIHNLLRNACRYSLLEVNVIIEITDYELMIHIDDDGIGIAEGDRQRVFEPFSRLDDSRNRSSGGHGLGLAIAKRIMNAHNGNIIIDDSPLGGARFTLILKR
jgi:two-component system sensor histidine kinase RstB